MSTTTLPTEAPAADQSTRIETAHPNDETCIYPSVYVRLVGEKNRASIYVYDKQGIAPLRCQYAVEGFRDQYSIGTWFKADVQISRDGKFYRVRSEPKLTSEPQPRDLEAVKAANEHVFQRWTEEKEKNQVILEEKMKKSNGIPEIPSTLFIRRVTWNLLSIAVNKGRYPLILGPKGCGKTEAAEALAKALNMNFRAFNLGAVAKPKQYFAGIMQASEKGTEFLQSEFLTAFESKEPTLIYLDEATRMSQATSNYLMSILDRKQNYVYVEELGRRVYKSDSVRFIAAANVGMQYTDTRTLDGALWDRFIKLSVDYLSEEDELKLIKLKVPEVPSPSMIQLIKWANTCRQKERESELSTGVSSRQLLDMAEFLASGIKLDEVYEEVFLHLFVNGQQDERDIVRTFIASSGS